MKRRLTVALMGLGLSLVAWIAMAGYNPQIVEMDLDIVYLNADDPTETDPGGFVCVGERREIKLTSKSLEAGSKVRLSWDTARIQVEDAAGTAVVADDTYGAGVDYKDYPANTTMSLYVKGTAVSGGPRDVAVTLEALHNTPALSDTVRFTVVQVESITVIPRGTPDGYALPDPVKIAAGAFASAAHQADVLIQVLPKEVGIPIDVNLLDGRGHEPDKDAKLVSGSVTALGGGVVKTMVTIAGGKIEGVLTSSDVINSCTIHTCTKDRQVVFTWDEFDGEEWYEDTDGDGSYTPGEPFTDADGNGEWTSADWTSEPLYLVTPGTSQETLRLRHNRGEGNDANSQPLDQHMIRFYVEEVTYLDENDMPVTLPCTPDDDLSEWASFPADPTPTSSEGMVTVTLKMEDKPEMISLVMAAYDFSVWDEPAKAASATVMAPMMLESMGETPPVPPAAAAEKGDEKKGHSNRQQGNSRVTVVFKESEKNNGFDDTTAIPWLIVPVNNPPNTKTAVAVISSASPAASVDFRFEGTTPAKADVLPTTASVGNHTVTFTGKAQGVAQLDKEANGFSLRVLNLRVVDKKTVNVALHFMSDNTGRKSNKTAADADAIIQNLNDVFTPQANVVFVKHSVGTHTVPKDLPVVDWYPDSNDPRNTGDDVVAFRAAGANVNLFFVWALAVEGEVSPVGATGGSDCLIEDNPCSSIAPHEVGHVFGLSDRQTGDTRALMWFNATHGDTKIFKSEVDVIHQP